MRAVRQSDDGVVVVLTALNLEYRAVRAHLTDLERSVHRLGTAFEVGYLPGLPVGIVLGRTGEGNAAAAVLAGRAIEAFAPRALMFVGVAGALRDDLDLGDVVVATRVYAPHGGKEQDGRFLTRPRVFEAPHALLDLAAHLDATRDWAVLGERSAPVGFHVHFKPVAAGEVVLNSRTTPLAQQLHEHYNDAAAIEMESAGVAQAAHLSNALPALTVRGISDKADGLKRPSDDKAWQPAAAAHAAAVALAVIQEWIETTPPPPAPGSARGEQVGPFAGRAEHLGRVGRLVETTVEGGLRVTGAQAADASSVLIGSGSKLEWPHRVGVLPRRADCYQTRPRTESLLHTTSASNSTAAYRILTGLGGAGKTQLALEYARKSWDSGNIDLLIWITAGTRESIIEAYAEAAADIIGDAGPGAAGAANRLLSWLAKTRRRWLVILDDVANPSHLNLLWPPDTPSGQTIITTRRHDAALSATGGNVIDVGLFDEDESQNYLLRKFASHGRIGDDVSGLASDLGHLPLALAQASAYMVDRQLTCREYRERLADRKRRLVELLPEPDALPDAHRHTVSAAWSLSIELADGLAPRGLARPLLELASVLDPNGIPMAVLTAPPALAYLRSQAKEYGGQVDEERARDALYCLQRLSLVSVNPHSRARTIGVHGLVQRATLEQIAHQGIAVQAAADALFHVWPEVEHDQVFGQALRANAMVLGIDRQDTLWRPNAHPVLFRVERSLDEIGLVAAAYDFARRLLEEADLYLGPTHPDTLTARADLADRLGKKGDWAGAATAFEALVADCVSFLGPEHEDTLRARHNHAHWRGHAGEPGFAVARLETLLADQIRVIGPEHLDTLVTRGNLAHWRGEAGDARGALAELETLLSLRRRILGPDHPRTLICRMCIAFWRGSCGDAASAVEALRALCADQERILGPEHPDTLTTRSNIAHWSGCAGEPGRAVGEFERLLSDRLRILGPDNPRTLVTRANLAHWRGELGDAGAAVIELEGLLGDQLRVLGARHIDTLGTRGSLAHWSGKAGFPARATTQLTQLLADQTALLGPLHADTETTARTLYFWQREAGAGASTSRSALDAPHDRAGRRRRVSE